MSRMGASNFGGFELACLALLLVVAATTVPGVSATPPSTADLANCPKSCGGVNISYPYGIGRGCFRPGFEVTCNHSTRPPKLFLGNTTTEILQQYPSGSVKASVIFNIPTRPHGAAGTTYNVSWESPGGSLYTYFEEGNMVIVGCGIEAYMFNATDLSNILGFCATTCGDIEAMEKEAEGGSCSGMGCCYIVLGTMSVTAFRLSIIQKEEALPPIAANATVKAFLADNNYYFSMTDLLSDKVNESTIGASYADLLPVITDQPNCGKARKHEQYACAASSCVDYGGNEGYYCACANQVYYDDGNPYVVGVGGCSTGKHCSSKLT